jgi:inorganic pyrophosphatase
VCCDHLPSAAEIQALLRFFSVYARCKGLLNLWRRRPGRNGCDGWHSAAFALARARPLQGGTIRPAVPY